MSADELAGAVAGLPPIGLEELDARAALQRRTDRKYLVASDRLAAVVEELRRDHEALEIAGTRAPSYESVYFDTPDLRCFADHLADRAPRFKIRSRLYVDTRICSFEVKVKQHEEMVKKHLTHPQEDHGKLTDPAREFVDATLLRCTGAGAPRDLRPALTTAFRRSTLAARDGSERVTIDAGLRLTRPDGARAELGDGLVLVEVKSSGGGGRCNEVLARAGVEEIGLSKYRTGIALLTGRPQDATAAASSFRVDGGPAGSPP